MEGFPLFELGFIQRTHGIKGEVQLSIVSAVDEPPTKLESVFLEIEGIPVPFFVESIRNKAADKLILKLEDVDDVETAEGLTGFKVYIPANLVEISDDTDLGDLVGYTVVSTQGETVGLIVRYEDYGMNAVYAIESPSITGEVLIPASDELIVEFDADERIVTMELPIGLFGAED